MRTIWQVSTFLGLGACVPADAITMYIGSGEAEVRQITRRFDEPWGTLPPPPTRLLGNVGFTEEGHTPILYLTDEQTAEPYYPPRAVWLDYNSTGSYPDGYAVGSISFYVYGEWVADDPCLEYWKDGAMEVNATVTDYRKERSITADFWMDGNALPDHTPIECWNQFQLDMTFRSVGEMSWELGQVGY